MDYFIDDMLDASARGSRKSDSHDPAPSEPPLSPSPPPTRRKKTKSVKFPKGRSSSEASSSKYPEISTPAATPIWGTSAPSTSEAFSDLSTYVEAESHPDVSPEGVAGQQDYFSVAEPAPPAETQPGILGPSHAGGSPSLSPMSELPPPAFEMSKAAEELPAANEHPTEQASVVEERGAIGDPTGKEDTSRDTDDSVPPMIHVAHQPIPTVHNQEALLIGISGSPSSGKTTLAPLLSVILPETTPSFIVHQDDFLVPDHLMIPSANRELASHRHTANLSAFKRFLEYSKREGGPPQAFKSTQPIDQREGAMSHVPSEVLERLRSNLSGIPSLQEGRPIGIVEGDMLYHSKTIRGLLDIKILLRATREESKARRFDRAEGQDAGHERRPWDTREYFNRTLWPHYAKEHAVLFEHRDVEGRPKLKFCQEVGITVQPMLNMSLDQTLQWMVDVICKESEGVMDRHDREMASMIDGRVAFEFCECNDGFLGRIRQAIFDFL